MINALDKAWHPEHFACATCKQPLNNSFFHGDDMIPYCEKHYYASQGLLCAACDKPILTGMEKWQQVSEETREMERKQRKEGRSEGREGGEKSKENRGGEWEGEE